jgi:hypothetical protein
VHQLVSRVLQIVPAYPLHRESEALLVVAFGREVEELVGAVQRRARSKVIRIPGLQARLAVTLSGNSVYTIESACLEGWLAPLSLEPDERILVEAAQRGPSRFAELYERNFDRVYAYSRGASRGYSLARTSPPTCFATR